MLNLKGATIPEGELAMGNRGAGIVDRRHPVVEISTGHVATIGGGVFDVETVYGTDRFWSVIMGVRVGTGMGGHRMGRYGAMEDEAMSEHHHGGMAE